MIYFIFVIIGMKYLSLTFLCHIGILSEVKRNDYKNRVLQSGVNQRKDDRGNEDIRRYKNMIKILFVCHGMAPVSEGLKGNIAVKCGKPV